MKSACVSQASSRRKYSRTHANQCGVGVWCNRSVGTSRSTVRDLHRSSNELFVIQCRPRPGSPIKTFLSAMRNTTT